MATILGLLLVVTFIANYLTATLPGQMSVNDLNHVIQVENQVGRLQALLEAGSAADAVGAQFTQPITLGSAGTPPFASADLGTIGPANGSSSFTTNLTGPLVYTPPTVGAAGGIHSAGCTTAATSVVCTGSNYLTWNFTTSATNYVVTTSAGSYSVNIKDSGTTGTPAGIAVTPTGSAPLDLFVLGSNDTITLTLATTASVVNLVVVGNYDTLAVSNTVVTSFVSLVEVGLHDATTFAVGTGVTFLASIFGTTDTVAAPTTANSNGATNLNVFYTGFGPTTTTCPNDNMASTDKVTVSSTAGNYTANYNTTSAYTPTPVADWSLPVSIVTSASANCPFFAPSSLPLNLGGSAAGVNIHLLNTYIPEGDVAFDQGGVVYAQEGGVPIMIDGPAITATMVGSVVTAISIWFPVFEGSLAIQSGVSTAEISARLLSLDPIDLTPTSGNWLTSNSNIVLTIQTPFAAAWANWFNSTLPFNTEWSCVGPNAACNGPYISGGALGTVTLTIPTTSQLAAVNLQIATFAISLI